jgi:hypothetical protein
MLSTDEALLDNPVYAALSGAHARFAQVRGRARRYPVDVAPFVALPSQPSAQDWQDAAGLFVPGTYAAVLHDGAEIPQGWKVIRAFDAVQMIGERVTGLDCAEAISLGATDVPEMLELVAHTEPGPFLNLDPPIGWVVGWISRDRGGDRLCRRCCAGVRVAKSAGSGPGGAFGPVFAHGYARRWRSGSAGVWW